MKKILRKYQEAIINYLAETDTVINEDILNGIYLSMIPAICGFIYLDNKESESKFFPFIPEERKLELKRTILKNIYKI